MKNLLMRDLKHFGILFIGYLILQYVAVLMVERVGMLIGNNAPYYIEYLYYFLMVVGILFLTLGSLLVLIYLIIRPAIEDKKEGYELNESVALYRLLGLLITFFLGLFNFFVALAVITDFDLKIIFEQSINLYIGLSFGIQAVLSIVLIIYNKIYNNRVFSSKLNIVFNIVILIIIYTAGYLYFYYYFKYGMMLLLIGYIFLFLNIKLVSKAIFTNIITKVIWVILLVTIVGLLGLSFIKGENKNREETRYQDTEVEKFQQEISYSYEDVDSKYGTMKKYDMGEKYTSYVFTYNNKSYSVDLYDDGTSNGIRMKNPKNMEYVNISANGGSKYYIESTVLQSDEVGKESYLSCGGSYTEEEVLKTPCVDDDTKEVFGYLNETLKKEYQKENKI